MFIHLNKCLFNMLIVHSNGFFHARFIPLENCSENAGVPLEKFHVFQAWARNSQSCATPAPRRTLFSVSFLTWTRRFDINVLWLNRKEKGERGKFYNGKKELHNLRWGLCENFIISTLFSGIIKKYNTECRKCILKRRGKRNGGGG